MIPGANAGTPMSTPQSNGISSLHTNIAYRDNFSSDQELVAHLESGIPFTPRLPTNVPNGLQLRAAKTEQAGPAQSLELDYGFSNWSGGSWQYYNGPLMNIVEMPPAKYLKVGPDAVQIDTHIAGVALWEVRGLPADQIGFHLLTPTMDYNVIAWVRGTGVPTRGEVLSMMLALAQQG